MNSETELISNSRSYRGKVLVKRLSRVVFPYGTKVRVMAMFTAYFDESGTHGNKSPTVTVGGFLGSNQQWAKFEKSWAKLLKDIGVSCFHMTDLLGGHKEFTGWTLQMRDKAIEKAFNIIRRHAMVPVAVGVKVKDYQELDLSRQPSGTPKDPYAFCVLLCLQSIAKWVEVMGHREPIAYIFESGAKGRGVVDEFIRGIQRSEERAARYRVGSWTFSSKKNFLPLQSADVLAYITYTIGYEHVLKRPSRIVKPGMEIDVSLRRLLQKRIKDAKYCGFYEKQHLLAWQRYHTPYRFAR